MSLNPTCDCGHKMNQHELQGACRKPGCSCPGYLKPGNERMVPVPPTKPSKPTEPSNPFLAPMDPGVGMPVVFRVTHLDQPNKYAEFPALVTGSEKPGSMAVSLIAFIPGQGPKEYDCIEPVGGGNNYGWRWP